MLKLRYWNLYFKTSLEITLAISHFIVIGFIAWLFARRWSAENNLLFWSSFIFHLIAGISVGLVYKYYYTSNDTWLFFDDASRLSIFARENFVGYIKMFFDFSDPQTLPGIITGDFRSLIFIKILSLFCFVSGNSYWVCAGYFALLSFFASWFLYQQVIQSFPDSSVAAAMAFLLFPSIVFWGSGIEKETLALASLYFLMGVCLRLTFNKKMNAFLWTLTVIANLILWALKYYCAGVFFIATVAAWMAFFFSKKNLIVRKYIIPVYLLLFAVTGVAASFLHPNFYLHRFLDVLVSNHDAFVKLSAEDNLIHFNQLKPTITSVISNAPWALLSGIFRPVIGEGHGALGFFASVENLLLLTLFASFWWNLKKRLPITIPFLAVISYCTVLCIFLTLSTPNFGTLSRYRVGFLPFLVFVFSYRNTLVDYLTRKFLNASKKS